MNPLLPGLICPAVGHVLHRRGSHECHTAAPPAGHDADPAGDPSTVCSAWSLTITCLSAMTDRDEQFVII